MARILVVGGTGTAGRSTVAEAVRRGHEVTVASRHAQSAAHGSGGVTRVIAADAITGKGLDDAFEGQDVFIDTTNGLSRSMNRVLTIGSRNLLQVAGLHGVGRAVLLSIVGVRTATFSYYRLKAQQEQIYLDSALDTRVVEATQFHNLITSMFDQGRKFGVIPALRGVWFQTIATSDVARALLDAATSTGQRNSSSSVGGPQTVDSRALAQTYKRITASRAAVVGFRLPGAMGASWRSGENLAPGVPFGTVTFEQWLRERLGR